MKSAASVASTTFTITLAMFSCDIAMARQTLASSPEVAHQLPSPIHWSLFLLLLALLFAALTSVLLLVKHFRLEVARERQRQQQRFVEYTREITLFQSMINTLNEVQHTSDAGHVISKVLSKLLSEHSGALFLTQPDGMTLQELCHWGEYWPNDIAVFACRNNGLGENACCYRCNTHLTCHTLQQNGKQLGILQLHHPSGVINAEFNSIIKRLAQHLSNALANMQLKAQLREQAIRDPLTNLYNRRFMFEILERTLHRAQRHQQHLAILMVDIDHFKHFNDKFGHGCGDMILADIAGHFKKIVRLEDVICRYGGEEFCLICPDTRLPDAYSLAEKLRCHIEQLNVSYKETPLPALTISIGIALFPNNALQCSQLINGADAALYQAKRRGRNCTVVAQSTAVIQSEQ